MSRMLFLWAIGPALALFAASRAFVVAVVDRVSEVWPIAFPASASMYRSQGVRLSREDAKPLAQRLRDYRYRVLARSGLAPLPRLIAA